MNFHIGQKVVCVDDQRSFRLGNFDDPHRVWLVQDRVYTVRAIFVTDTVIWDETPGEALLLKEIVNPGGRYGFYEPGFYSRRFRPLIDRNTDISVFTTMLKAESRP